MQEFIKAIKTKAATVAAVTGGCHFGAAPDKAAFPFAVFYVLNAPHSYIYGSAGKDPYDVTIEWRVLSNSAESCQTAIDAIVTEFEDDLLTITGSSNHHVTRGDNPFAEMVDGKNLERSDAEKVWEASTTFTYGVRAN